MSVAALRAGAILTVDLDALVNNWQLLNRMAAPAACAAVVKADAYGLGAAEVAAALEAVGCRSFFVAHLEEGIILRSVLAPNSSIFVLNGTPPGTEPDFAGEKLIPVINSRNELAGWRDHARRTGARQPIALQVDSGMTRLGLSEADAAEIAADPATLDGLDVGLLLSHLACADEPSHPANEAQLLAFERMRAGLPAVRASLANSSGIFLGAGYHFDLVRPGAALYGINPTPQHPNPMRPVVRVEARVVLLRDTSAGACVGYGHTVSTGRRSRLATVSLGYADGWPRNAAGAATFRGQKLPLIGRVSMDSIVIDVTGCAEPLREGDFVELIGPHASLDDVAAAAGTIGYEILTGLGHRFHRRHVGKRR